MTEPSFTTVKCSNCKRPLVELMIRPAEDVRWRVEVICGYPDCNDRAFPITVNGLVSPVGYHRGDTRVVDLVDAQADPDSHTMTLHTRPAGKV